MKQLKRCDGYVLPYVLVVFLILSAVSVSICTTSLNNLKAQEAAVKRAQALYDAEGEIERLVAEVVTHQQENGYELKSDARTAFRGEIDLSQLRLNYTGNNVEGTDDAFVLTVQAKSIDDSVVIDAIIQIEVDFVTETRTEGEQPTYKVSTASLKEYKSYNISYKGGGAG